MPAGYETWQHDISMDTLGGIGDRIKDARNSRPEGEITQNELAELLSANPETKASRITVGVWERGKVLPPLEKIFAIAGITGTDPLWLITGKTDMQIRSEVVEIPHCEVASDNSVLTLGTVMLSMCLRKHRHVDC